MKTFFLDRKIVLSFFLLILFHNPQAFGKPTEEETIAFFSRQRQDKVDFDRGILAETDSRTAATLAFNQRLQADRRTFTRSLPNPPSQEDMRRLADFNAAMLERQKDFRAALPTLSKSKFEKAIEDFDKKALDDRNALNGQLSASDPEGRAEAMRQFQNTRLQERSKLKNDTFNAIAARQRQFKQEQSRRTRDFLGSD